MLNTNDELKKKFLWRL